MLHADYTQPSVGLSQTSANKPTVEFGGFGGLQVACWPFVPKFAGSIKRTIPTEAVGFFRAKKSSARLP